MRNTTSELTVHGYNRIIESISRYKVLLQALFLITMAAVSAYWKKNTLDLGIPGSSAVLWLGPMIIGRLAVRRKCAGTFTGMAVALWGLLFTLKNPFIYNLGLYGGTGLALDVAASFPKVNIRNIFGAIFCGIFAHMVKFGFIVGAAMTSSSVRHFVVVGTAKAAGLHILFGACAGVAAWVIYKIQKLIIDRK
jgi:hypothetical protein